MRGWRNRQTRWIQVPVPARAWGFNSPLAHQQHRRNGLIVITMSPFCSAWAGQARCDGAYTHDCRFLGLLIFSGLLKCGLSHSSGSVLSGLVS
jgi:hypothetical protein